MIKIKLTNQKQNQKEFCSIMSNCVVGRKIYIYSDKDSLRVLGQKRENI